MKNTGLIDSLTADFSLCWRTFIDDFDHKVFLSKLKVINERSFAIESRNQKHFERILELELRNNISKSYALVLGCLRAIEGVHHNLKANESVRSLIKAASLIAHQLPGKISEVSAYQIQKTMEGILTLAEKHPIECEELLSSSPSSVSGEEGKILADGGEKSSKKVCEPAEPCPSKPSKPSKKTSSSSTLVLLLLRSYSSFPFLNSLDNAPATITKCFGHLLKTDQYVPAINYLSEKLFFEHISADEIISLHNRLMLAKLFSPCCNLLETLHGHILSKKGKSFSSISVSRMNGQQLISMASSTVSKLMEVDSSSSLKLAMSICVKFGFEEWRKEIKMRTTEMKMRHFVTKGKSLLAIQVARTGEEQLCLYNCLIEEKLFIEAQEVLRSFRWLAGKVAPISQADLALQHQSDRTKYLQFPAHTVSIHMVDSMESLSFAASVIGVSLEADHYLDESQCIDSGDGDVIDASKKTAANESRNLRHFLERGVKGFRQVVGLDSEWRMIMYAKEIKGASILQISTSQHVFIVDFLTLFRPTSSKPATLGRRRKGGNTHRPGPAVKRDYRHIDENSSLSSESLADVAARFLERLFADSTILKLGWSFGEDMKMVKKAMGGNRPDTLLVTRSLLELSDLPNIFPQEQVGSTELECDEELDDPLSDKGQSLIEFHSL